jgi:hypothetical protein
MSGSEGIEEEVHFLLSPLQSIMNPVHQISLHGVKIDPN